MSQEDLHKSWSVTRKQLEEARNHLSPTISFKQFDEYLDRNELELALDELIALEPKKDAAKFWMNLAEAAKNMQLDKKAEFCTEKAKAAVSII